MKVPKPIDIPAAAAILGVTEARARQLCLGRPWCQIISGVYVIDRACLVQFQASRQKTPGRPAKDQTEASE